MAVGGTTIQPHFRLLSSSKFPKSLVVHLGSNWGLDSTDLTIDYSMVRIRVVPVNENFNSPPGIIPNSIGKKQVGGCEAIQDLMVSSRPFNSIAFPFWSQSIRDLPLNIDSTAK